MRTTIVAALCGVCLLVSACSFEYTEVQDIEISHFADNKSNAKLTKELIYYDPVYLADQIQAFDAETSKGIRLGYFVRSSDGKPSYRVTYNRSIDAVSESLDDLKRQFEAYIPVLAATHASKGALFVELEPAGLSWVQDFFTGDASALLGMSSQLLRDYVTVAQLSKYQRDLAAAHGSPTEISFVRAQFYKKFSDVPESVSLYYEAQMNDESSYLVRVSFHQTGREWLAIGFRFDKIR